MKFYLFKGTQLMTFGREPEPYCVWSRDWSIKVQYHTGSITVSGATLTKLCTSHSSYLYSQTMFSTLQLCKITPKSFTGKVRQIWCTVFDTLWRWAWEVTLHIYSIFKFTHYTCNLINYTDKFPCFKCTFGNFDGEARTLHHVMTQQIFEDSRQNFFC